MEGRFKLVLSRAYKTASFNAGKLASGVYYYRINAGGYMDTK